MSAAALLAHYRAALEDTDIVILSDYGKGVLDGESPRSAIAAATAAGKRVLVDPKSRSFAKYRGATVLTPNKHELQSASGHECSTDAQVVAAARDILARGICRIVVATRGHEGMSIVPDGSALHIRTIGHRGVRRDRRRRHGDGRDGGGRWPSGADIGDGGPPGQRRRRHRRRQVRYGHRLPDEILARLSGTEEDPTPPRAAIPSSARSCW